MTLDEQVERMPDEVMLYIGSCAAFFFIGTKAEYYEQIDKVSDFLKAKILRKNRYRLKEMPEEKLQKFLAARKEEADSFVNPRARDVLVAYRRYDGSCAIKVWGKESGNFWVQSEYDEWAKKF